jgi:hypothetical protein
MYLHNFTQTSKEHGFDLDAHIRSVIRSCGVQLNCECPDCQDAPSPQVMQYGIETLYQQIQTLQARIDELERLNGHS